MTRLARGAGLRFAFGVAGHPVDQGVDAETALVALLTLLLLGLTVLLRRGLLSGGAQTGQRFGGRCAGGRRTRCDEGFGLSFDVLFLARLECGDLRLVGRSGQTVVIFDNVLVLILVLLALCFSIWLSDSEKVGSCTCPCA